MGEVIAEALATQPGRGLRSTWHHPRLLVLGRAVLADEPELLGELEEDEDDGSYADAAGDVQRRLDLIAQHKALFETSAMTPAIVAEASSVVQDAELFRRGSEGLRDLEARTRERRLRAFTLVHRELRSLQAALRLTYADDPSKEDRINGRYWRTLESLARPRRSAPAAPEIPAITETAQA